MAQRAPVRARGRRASIGNVDVSGTVAKLAARRTEAAADDALACATRAALNAEARAVDARGECAGLQQRLHGSVLLRATTAAVDAGRRAARAAGSHARHAGVALDHGRLIAMCAEIAAVARNAAAFAEEQHTACSVDVLEVVGAAKVRNTLRLMAMGHHWRGWNVYAMGRQSRRYLRKRWRAASRAYAAASAASAYALARASSVHLEMTHSVAYNAVLCARGATGAAVAALDEAETAEAHALTLYHCVKYFQHANLRKGWHGWTCKVALLLRKRYVRGRRATAKATKAARAAADVAALTADIAKDAARCRALERGTRTAEASLFAARGALDASAASRAATNAVLAIASAAARAGRAAAGAASAAARASVLAMDSWFVARAQLLRRELAVEVGARTAAMAALAAQLAAHEVVSIVEAYDEQHVRALSSLSIDETCALLIAEGFSSCVARARSFAYSGDVIADPIFARCVARCGVYALRCAPRVLVSAATPCHTSPPVHTRNRRSRTRLGLAPRLFPPPLLLLQRGRPGAESGAETDGRSQLHPQDEGLPEARRESGAAGESDGIQAGAL